MLQARNLTKPASKVAEASRVNSTAVPASVRHHSRIHRRESLLAVINSHRAATWQQSDLLSLAPEPASRSSHSVFDCMGRDLRPSRSPSRPQISSSTTASTAKRFSGALNPRLRNFRDGCARSKTRACHERRRTRSSSSRDARPRDGILVSPLLREACYRFADSGPVLARDFTKNLLREKNHSRLNSSSGSLSCPLRTHSPYRARLPFLF